jgi:hypothetical protein
MRLAADGFQTAKARKDHLGAVTCRLCPILDKDLEPHFYPVTAVGL